ncbi:peptidoglycan recognition protein 2 [Triplophysa rosa]|uniref:Peptidoglycan recognition protein 2 n=1 Tax=Triplophysa rosa TaxID=992332 RepID=A0A9W8C457_TRIRA|nr:peptidoglycan recognition protein 2 [Triplophysa rosa]
MGRLLGNSCNKCLFYLYLVYLSVHMMTMEHFVAAVQRLEDLNPTLTPLDLLASLLTTLSQRDNITCGIIGSSDNSTDVHYTDSNNTFITAKLNGNGHLCRFFNQAIHHFITDDREERGVVLTPDGTTVALSPLLLGVEMGLQATKDVTQPHGIYLLPLAKTLGLSFLQFQNSTPPERLGPDGCWDNISSPVVFTLSGEPSLATDAVVHGGMDGAIIGRHFSVVNDSEVKLSEVLSSYYSDGMELEHSHPRGRYRRRNFQNITNASLLQKKVADALKSHRQRENAAEESLIEEGMREFALRYMDCPTIIPRCVWGAAPPRVPLHSLSPPLQFLYIHHTSTPSKPCLNHQMCSQNMREMQQFHQKDRGWHDIGYSFVIGSDGYVYEGRGWMSQGAHTRGRNLVGYGIAFIGDYTSQLPSRYTMELVRHHLVKCGVSKGFLQKNFTMLGHRQVVNTSCPGDSLYSEIKTWKHFKDTDPLKFQ